MVIENSDDIVKKHMQHSKTYIIFKNKIIYIDVVNMTYLQLTGEASTVKLQGVPGHE